MDARSNAALTGIAALAGVAVAFALAVYPWHPARTRASRSRPS